MTKNWCLQDHRCSVHLVQIFWQKVMIYLIYFYRQMAPSVTTIAMKKIVLLTTNNSLVLFTLN